MGLRATLLVPGPSDGGAGLSGGVAGYPSGVRPFRRDVGLGLPVWCPALKSEFIAALLTSEFTAALLISEFTAPIE